MGECLAISLFLFPPRLSLRDLLGSVRGRSTGRVVVGSARDSFRFLEGWLDVY